MNAVAEHCRRHGAARRILRLAPVLGLCATAACSAGPAPMASDPVAAVRDAAAASARIHFAKVATEVTITVAGSQQDFRGTGEFDFDQRIGAFTVTPAQNASPLDEVITPATLFLRPAGRGGTWRWISASRLPDGDVLSAGYTSPLIDFALLRGVTGSGAGARYIGQDSVRGTPVTHYAGILNLASSAAAAADPMRTALLAAERSLSRGTVPFDVYLDSQGRVRRMIAHYSFAAPSPQHGVVEIASTTDLYELDTPVAVASPTDAEPAASATSAPPKAKPGVKAKASHR